MNVKICWTELFVSVILIVLVYTVVSFFTGNHMLATVIGVAFYLFGFDVGNYLWNKMKSFTKNSKRS